MRDGGGVPSKAARHLGAPLVWLAATAVPAGAQVADTARDSSRVVPLQEISVTVTRWERPLIRLPFAISTLDLEAIQGARRTVSLDESLRFTPGLFVHNRRNFSLGDRLTMRGVGARAQFGVRGIRVLADGIPLTLADGQTTLTNLDLASAGRVEVIRGPASALYGNSSGGVISVRTEAAPEVLLRLEPLVLAGSNGFYQTRLKAAGQAGGVDYVANFDYLDTEGFREYAAAEILRVNTVASLLRSENADLRLLFNFYRTPFAESPSSLVEEDARTDPTKVRPFIISQGAGEQATQGQGGISLDLALGSDTGLKAAAWGLWRDLWNPIPGRIIAIDRIGGGLRGELGGHVPIGDLGLRWAAGADLELQRDDREEFENEGVPEGGDRAVEGARLIDQLETVVGLGPFLQAELAVSDRWIVSLAGRYDMYRFEADDSLLSDGDDSGERTFRHFSPSLGVTFAASDRVNLYGNFATAFQTPTASELSNRPDGSGGFDPELEPELIRSWEVGLRGYAPGARLGYEISGFIARVTDALVPRAGPTEEVFFVNAGEVERLGLEAGLVWAPTAGLLAQLGYTLQRLRFVEFETAGGDFSGNGEPGVPTHWLTLGLSHTAGFGIRSELELRLVDDYPVDDANSAQNWAYTVADLRVTLDRTTRGFPLRVFAAVENLFDTRYNGSVVPNAFGARYYEPAPGVEVYIGFSWPISIR